MNKLILIMKIMYKMAEQQLPLWFASTENLINQSLKISVANKRCSPI